MGACGTWVGSLRGNCSVWAHVSRSGLQAGLLEGRPRMSAWSQGAQVLVLLELRPPRPQPGLRLP